MTDIVLRDRIAAVLRDRLLNEIEGAVNGVDNIYVGDYVGDSTIHLTALADAVIAALRDGWTLVPPDDGRGTYADNFCRGGCDCSCCYGMADWPCHCRDAICNCGGDRAAHGQKPLEDK